MAQKVSLHSAKPLGSSLQTVAADLFIGQYRTLRSALPPVSHWHDLVLSTEARSAPERSQQYPVRRCYIYIYQNFLRIILINNHSPVNSQYGTPGLNLTYFIFFLHLLCSALDGEGFPLMTITYSNLE